MQTHVVGTGGFLTRSAGKRSSSGCFANALNLLLSILTISVDSLLTIVFFFVSHRIGTVYLPFVSCAMSYSSLTFCTPLTTSGTHPSHEKLPLPFWLEIGGAFGSLNHHPACSSTSGFVLSHWKPLESEFDLGD